MNIFHEVYARLDALPPEERIHLLQQLLPPQELFARMDGTRFIIRKHGLRIFDTSTLLTQAGIPEDDPRTQVFRELRGGLLEKDIPDALRAIASRVDTVCSRSGAIQVWEGGRKAWWVPVAGTSQFEGSVRRLIDEFEAMRDRLLLEDYDRVRSEAEQRWSDSCQAAWENLNRLGKNVSRDSFLSTSMATFGELFPGRSDIREKIHIDLVPVQRPLPEKIEKLLADLRQAERQKLEAETSAAREQMRLHSVEAQLKEEQAASLRRERLLRDQLLRQALDPQIEQAREILLQAQSSLMRLANEIFSAVEAGSEVSPATMRSWNQRLKTLSVLATGNAPLETALEKLAQLKQSARDPGRPSPEALKVASQRMEHAFADLERRAAQELHADQIWQLMRAGRGDEALQRLAEIRGRASNSLSEVDALWKLVSGVAARNEILEDERAEEQEPEAEEVSEIEETFQTAEVLHG
jgi:hypothetical protein